MKKRLMLTLIATLPLGGHAADFVRCTAADGSYSFIKRDQKPCPKPTDRMTFESAQTPIMPRSPDNRGPVKCTSHDGKTVTLQMGNCANPDDYQQRFPD